MDIDQIIEAMQGNFSDEEIKSLKDYFIAEYENEKVEPENIKQDMSAETVAEKINEEDINITQTDEPNDTAEPEQLELPLKENFFVKLARKSYNRKSKRAEARVQAVQKQILTLEERIKQLQKSIESINEKSKSISGEIIGLMNANTFLEINYDGGLIEKFLRLTIHYNNKKIAKLKNEIILLESKAGNFNKRITTLVNEIDSLKNSVPNRQKYVDEIKSKTDNLSKIGKFVNPLAGILVNMRNPELAADLEKYCYKKVTQEEFDKLQKEPFQCKYKRDNKLIIVKFPRGDLDLFNEVLA